MSIVNRKQKFIYLKSRKTASSSSEIHLIVNSEFGNDIYYTSREIVKMGFPRSRKNKTLIPGQAKYWFDVQKNHINLFKLRGVHRIFYSLLQHATLKRIQFLFGKKFFNEAFKITSVRNPWDALVSFYLWEKSGHQGRVSPKDIEWDSWLDSVLRIKEPGKLSLAQEFLLYPYIFLEGKLGIDQFIYFEDLESSFKNLSDKLGADIKPFTRNSFHFKKSKERKDYRFYFTDTQAEQVENHFRKYLDLIFYKYDEIGKTPCSVSGK